MIRRLIQWLIGDPKEVSICCPQCGKRTATLRGSLWSCYACFGYGVFYGDSDGA